ncbi:hypothetical protein K491DRAFT_722668 [Lophiostoma macrostomum CBS 122681]|uniref:Uncharacterized protein n=1 Tax=Lophiostoma macrostomum CBS 122681 TaxID=1314788 RepID=A0A6A6SL14_9PLEO|nr:hypothetical protein K491DRAFT_722668 [Lophiostoma macrostomum CBS 122681]
MSKPLRRLSKETRAELGSEFKFSRCVRCWKIQDAGHRKQWRQCRAACPACPGGQQHWGKACPNLLDRSVTNNEWWIAHCGCSKFDADRGQPDQMVGGQGRNRSRSPGSEDGEIKDNGSGAFRERSPLPTRPWDAELETSRQEWREEVSGRRMDRSSSRPRPADRDDGCRGRSVLTNQPRNSTDFYRSAREPAREPALNREPMHERPFNPPSGPRAKGSGSFNLPYRVPNGRKTEDRKADERMVDERMTDERKPVDCKPVVKLPPKPVLKLAPKSALQPALKPAPKSAATMTDKPVTKSSGTQTEASVYDQVMEHPGMRMFLHQIIVFADYFDRHPEATNGEQMVTHGMASYLRMAYAENPDYTNPNPPYEEMHDSPMETTGLADAAAEEFLKNAFPNGLQGPQK